MPTNGSRRASPAQNRANTIKTSKILGLPINAGTFEEVSAAIFDAARSGTAGYVCVANVHMFTLARRSQDLARIIEQAAFVTSDGMPLVWTLRRKGIAEAERVYGAGLMDDLCRRAAAASMPVYLFGGAEATLSRLTETLCKRHPDLRLAGAEAPPMLPQRPELDETVAERIRKSGAGLVFVGLGCPKQEYWMASHAQRAGALSIGVGAAFDFIAGTAPQAPGWMQRAGLEWLYRLAREPRRLFARYLVSNTAFVFYLIRGKL